MGGSSAYNGQTVAILENGSVWTWGSDRYGQLGNGEVSADSAPTRVSVPAGISFALVDSGGATEYGIDTQGAVWSWGQNNQGELGTKHHGPSDVPAQTGLVLSCVSSTAANVADWLDQQHATIGCDARKGGSQFRVTHPVCNGTQRIVARDHQRVFGTTA